MVVMVEGGLKEFKSQKCKQENSRRRAAARHPRLQSRPGRRRDTVGALEQTKGVFVRHTCQKMGTPSSDVPGLVQQVLARTFG